MVLNSSFGMFINILLLVLLVVFTYVGYKKGFIIQFIDIIGLLVAFLVARVLSKGMSELIQLTPKNFNPFNDTILGGFFYNRINEALWFIIIFIVVLVGITILKHVLDLVAKLPVINTINKWLGVVMGLVKLLIVSIIIIFVLASPLFKNGRDVVDNSVLKPIESVSVFVIESLDKQLTEMELIQRFMIEPKSLTKEEILEIAEWLRNKGVAQEEIDQFFNNLGV